MLDGRWDVRQVEVLIVGGGFGGLWAAIRASEFCSSVLLVDKCFAGKSGHSYFASGAMMVCLPEDDLNRCVHDVTAGNDWLVDQHMVTRVFEGSHARLRDLESFGINFRKEKGAYVWTRARGTGYVKNIWPEHGSAADIVTTLRKVALNRGVKIINHVFVTGLLKSKDNNVVGAMGIGVRDGAGYLIRAKSTVLATNTGGFRGHHLAAELQGTGPFMAYEAGARLKNPEFHYINIRPAKHEIEGSGILPAVGARWINARREYYMERYEPLLKDRAPVHRIVLAAAGEALAGNAPVSIDVRGMSEENRERFRLLMVSHGWQPVMHEKLKREKGYDFLRDNIEWKPAYENNKIGIDIDAGCNSSLPGLFAAGMAGVLGINPFTGWSIASCMWSGYTAGESAGRHAINTDYGPIDCNYAETLYEGLHLPMQKETGMDPDKLIFELQKILFPVDVLIIMKGERLEQALGKIIALREEFSGALKAVDVRGLIKVRETETMLLAAEMTVKASLMRKETRPNIFCREDYPEPDNVNWLKWITVQKGSGGNMEFCLANIPFNSYKFKPRDNLSAH